jgi:hypothetical protein
MIFGNGRALLVSLILLSGCQIRPDQNTPDYPPMQTPMAESESEAPKIDLAFSDASGIELLAPDLNVPVSTQTATVAWSPVAGATGYYLGVGRSATAVSQSPWGDLFSKNVGLATSIEVNHLPLYGDDLYIRIWAFVGGKWIFSDFTVQTVVSALQRAELIAPAAGTELSGGPLALSWSEGSGALTYYLGVGTTQASVRQSPWGDVFHGDVRKNTSHTIEQIPAGVTTIYVRLWSYLKDHWEYVDYSFPVLRQATLQLSPVALTDQAAAVAQARFRFYRNLNGDYLNWGGLSEKWLRSLNEPTRQFFITPAGEIFRWDGSLKASFPGQSAKVATVDARFYDSLDLLTGIDVPSDPALMQAAFGFSAPYSTYQFNWGGQSEKWIRADLAGGAWYYLVPDGRLFRWDGSSKAVFPGKSTLTARLPTVIYENPMLLIQAPGAVNVGPNIVAVSAEGSGCSPGTTAVNIAPDLKALTVLFDSFFVSYDPDLGEEILQADCQVGVDLQIPAGWQVSMISLDIRGFADLPELSALQIDGAISYEGFADRIGFQQEITGPASEDFHQRGVATSETLLWSRCGGAQRLNLDISATLTPGPEAAYAAVDGIDGEITNKMGLVWRQCND